MSRAYRASVRVVGFNPERAVDIELALEERWDFEFEPRGRFRGVVVSDIDGTGDGTLGGGQTEEQFADELAVAAWKANGGPCEVKVGLIYLENPDMHTRSAADFERLGGAELLANDDEAA